MYLGTQGLAVVFKPFAVVETVQIGGRCRNPRRRRTGMVVIIPLPLVIACAIGVWKTFLASKGRLYSRSRNASRFRNVGHMPYHAVNGVGVTSSHTVNTVRAPSRTTAPGLLLASACMFDRLPPRVHRVMM